MALITTCPLYQSEPFHKCRSYNEHKTGKSWTQTANHINFTYSRSNMNICKNPGVPSDTAKGYACATKTKRRNKCETHNYKRSEGYDFILCECKLTSV